jgi:ESS family glutamate:Na+ symporter
MLFGRNYDSTVMASGLIGFGLGATPNALVCMQAITNKYGPSERAFFVVPIVGAFLVDISNATVISIMTGFFR